MDTRPKVMYEALAQQFGVDRDHEICAGMCYASVNMLKFIADKMGITFKELLEKIMEEET